MPLEIAEPAGISQRHANFKFKKAFLCGFACGKYPAQAVCLAWMGVGVLKCAKIEKHPLFIYSGCFIL